MNSSGILTLRRLSLIHICVCKKLVRFSIQPDPCIGCRTCATHCPVDAITRTDYIAPGHKLASMQIDTKKCVKFGACISNCKFNAITKA